MGYGGWPDIAVDFRWRSGCRMMQALAEKLGFRCPAPKGASDFEELTASLKRCPDTKREFFSELFSC